MKRLKRLLVRTAYLLLLFLMLPVSLTFAQSPSPGSTESPSPAKEEKVKDLKEKLATKVAQLRENQKRGLYGEIKSLGKSTFTLSTGSGDAKVNFNEDVVVVDLTGKRTHKDISSLKNTLTVAVLGFYDEKAKESQAKVIFIQILAKHFWGEITAIDKTKGTFTTKQKSGPLSFDYERSTSADEYSTTEKKLKKSGLSRLVVGDFVDVWATTNQDEVQTAVRLLRLPKELVNIEVSGEAASPAASGEPKESPAASSRSSPKASVKATPKPSPKASPAES